MAYGETYEQFAFKFTKEERAHTTDDCYTPAPIYDALADWVADHYQLDRNTFVRPFYPELNYELYDYPQGCTVVDNPPFSIVTTICAYYQQRGIPFFLFAPTLTLFQGQNLSRGGGLTFLPIDPRIEFELPTGGTARINVSFVTNLTPDIQIYCAPELYKILDAITKKKPVKPVYKYPAHVVTAAMCSKFTRNGYEFTVPAAESIKINRLGDMDRLGKQPFGGAFLVSDRIAKQAASIRKAIEPPQRDAIKWQLYESERRIIEELNKNEQ